MKGRLFARTWDGDEVVTGKLITTELPCMHDQMFRPVGAAVIGKQLRERLAGAEGNSVKASPAEQDVPAAFLRPAKV